VRMSARRRSMRAGVVQTSMEETAEWPDAAGTLCRYGEWRGRTRRRDDGEVRRTGLMAMGCTLAKLSGWRFWWCAERETARSGPGAQPSAIGSRCRRADGRFEQIEARVLMLRLAVRVVRGSVRCAGGCR
jgi:hypothetical protein